MAKMKTDHNHADNESHAFLVEYICNGLGCIDKGHVFLRGVIKKPQRKNGHVFVYGPRHMLSKRTDRPENN